MELPARPLVLGVDVDPPFQQVLAAWLGSRGLQTAFVPLADALRPARPAALLVCELAEPKRSGAQTMRLLAQAHPGTPLLAISARFVAGPHAPALARQLGAHAALAKPFSRYDLLAAVDAAAAIAKPASHA
jgi:CheY-like chemotaxis protein